MAPEGEPENDDAEDDVHGLRIVAVGPGEAGARLDKTLAGLLPEFSRARLQALIAEGRVSRDGAVVTDGSAKAVAGDYRIEVPAPLAAEPQAEAIPIVVLHEDAHLIVIDKPAGIAMHPAPGSESGTLVNALLHHCGDTLSGIGGVARPGIVHRIDKDTSGVVVVAKTDAAHQGLSALFAEHDIERVYVALVRGSLLPPRGTIEAPIARSTSDRKKMAVAKSGGRHAVTHYAVEKIYGPVEKPLAARVACRLETGRTHQIRVHLASRGAPCLGDPVYGSGGPSNAVKEAIAAARLSRQALHAAVLGFVHPITGETIRCESPLPPDMAALEAELSRL
ncbi:RluA family pseudouridine synthase [Phenylobacterium sp.]|uniref:RluA family pseudouridine synthase n=1 Tax=Phenylobacterium sp. TaxID=1871053 RepID=UPI0025D9AB54|nr:RluA family pseudouridine synthase [Phenylobacterium sp.]MBX3482682.1 RluA family pseudouridine synthase [Phenylobacterium sp.]MCW5760454.1 RluA family pseudouridine synthase [Phenylobacterium sp.]